MKPRTCESCQTIFTPQRMGARACSPMCAIRLVKAEKKTKAQAKKAERKADVEKLAKLAPRSKFLKDAQKAFNAAIVQRDASLPCVSCGSFSAGVYHAGHYRSVGSSPELRFDPFNVSKQCAQCNLFLSGNLLNYRIELVKRVGQAQVDRLEGPQEAQKWTIDQLKKMKAEFQAWKARMKSGGRS